MSITLGINPGSLASLRQLSRNTSALASTSERLSSGRRINRASDDAAGLAISMNLQRKSRVLDRATRNISDGVSALQIAEGALSSISGVLSRMAELATQAANGTLSYSQRKSLNAEFLALDSEIRRTARTTTFNGISLFEGTRKTGTGGQTVATGISNFNGASGDGRYMVTSNASQGVRLHDLVSGEIITIDAAAGAAQVVMSSGGDVVYSKNNNLYRYERGTGATTQITRSLGVESFGQLAISDDGSTIAFTSTTRYVNGSTGVTSGSGGTNLITVNVETGIFKNITGVGNGTLSGLALSEDGSRFIINVDLGAPGYDYIYADLRATNITARTLFTTSVPAVPPVRSVISNDGQLYFATYDDTLANTTNGSQIVRYNTNTNTMTQLTNYTDNFTYANPAIFSLRLSADQGTVHFFAAVNTGSNPNEYNQLFSLNVATRETTQLTNYTFATDGSGAHISADGSRVLWGSGTILGLDTTPQTSSVQIETGTGTAGIISVGLKSIQNAIRGLGGFSIGSRSGAYGALTSIHNAISSLGSFTSEIGAGMSRLESALGITTTQSLESQSALGRISDANIAEESAQLIRLQILQNVSASVLSQANQQPTLALTLLR